MALVFAYGSNLDAEQMLRRCPSSRLAGAATLDGYRLGFAGRSALWEGRAVATVEKCPGSRVPGLLWLISPSDLKRLDGFEGVPAAYRRQQVIVDADAGRALSALAYIRQGGAGGIPSARYFAVITRAYVKYGFNVDVLSDALQRATMAERGKERRWWREPGEDDEWPTVEEMRARVKSGVRSWTSRTTTTTTTSIKRGRVTRRGNMVTRIGGGDPLAGAKKALTVTKSVRATIRNQGELLFVNGYRKKEE